MYKELILFRNELKNKSVPKYKIVGIVSELVLSRLIFKKNIDIEVFLNEVFKWKFRAYLYKSRTMLMARLTKGIIELEKDNEYKNRLYKFVQKKIDEFKDNEKNERNQLNGWI